MKFVPAELDEFAIGSPGMRRYLHVPAVMAASGGRAQSPAR